MSDHSHAHIPEAEKFDLANAGNLPNLLLLAGVVGIAGSLVGALFARELFAYSWLFGFSYFFSLCVGSLFWICLHHATDAEWSVVVRRQLENVASLIPYLVLFFIPVLLCVRILYKWWDIGPGDDPLLDQKQPYLTHWFFLLRAAVYFLLLSWVSLSLRSLSTKQDADGSGKKSLLMRKFGVGGIPAVALSITFSGFDWLMGLDYHWFSTMWGVYLFAGAAGSSMSLLVLIVTALKTKGYLRVVNDEHYHIMGKFMLTFTVFWAYIGFSQYMLIWYANMPEETSYFIVRNYGNWWFLSTLLVVGRFFLPFAILLTQWIKKTPEYLKYVAIWVLFMQLVDIFVIVLPFFRHGGFGFFDLIFGLFTLVGIGGILGWLFFRKLTSDYLFPTKDPRLAASLKLTN